jgi:transposase
MSFGSAGVSRRTRCTKAICREAEKAAALGLSHPLIAKFIGVHHSQVYRWIQRGERERTGIYFEFCEAVKRGEGKCAALNMATIQKAARGGQWTAAAWVMERRFGYSVGLEAEPAPVEDAVEEGPDHWQTEQGLADLAADLEQLGPDVLARIAGSHPRVRELLVESLKADD